MIYLKEPRGKTISNPGIEYLKKILFENDKDFWCGTEMELKYCRGNENISLVLIHFDMNNSFYL